MVGTPEHVLLLFVDGLGIGHRHESNPCTSSPHFFNHVLDDSFPKPLDPLGYARGLDATLGVEGLPQSASGQTALLTGINAPRLLGRHLHGFPNEQLRRVIAEHSILKWFADRGYEAAFLNTFRPPFFDYDPFDIIKMLSVTSVTNLYAGLNFFDLDDLKADRSVYQDILGDDLRKRGFDVPIFTPEQAGEIIGTQSQRYHFSLFEYFQTDRAGHSQNRQRAVEVLNILERFLGAVLHNIDLQRTLVILTSDHGNIEDLSFRGHTRNPVMTLLFGAGSAAARTRLSSILDIYPLILSFFE